jgi:ribosome-binding protein aMBF1 (putative translation factor)
MEVYYDEDFPRPDKVQKARVVEVIDQGKIVKVDEDYAIREGLPIIRKGFTDILEKRFDDFKKQGIRKEEERRFHGDDLRKELNWKDNKIVKELIDNFHWTISGVRRKRGLTRKEFSRALGEDEETIKLLENGKLEANDFILIDKVEKYLGVNLRKKRIPDESPRKVVEENLRILEGFENKDSGSKNDKEESISGKDIEILE